MEDYSKEELLQKLLQLKEFARQVSLEKTQAVEEKESFKTKAMEIMRHCKDLSEKNTVAMNELIEIKEESQTLRSNLAKAVERLKSYKSELELSNDRVAALETALSEQQKLHSEAEKEDEREEKVQLLTQVQVLKGIVSQLTVRLESGERESSQRNEEERAVLMAEKSRLEMRVEQLQETVSQLTVRLESGERESSQRNEEERAVLMEEKSRLEMRVEQLQETVSQLTLKLETAEDVTEVLKGHLDRAVSKLKGFKVALDAKEEESSALRSEKERLESSMAQQQETLNMLQQVLESAEKEQHQQLSDLLALREEHRLTLIAMQKIDQDAALPETFEIILCCEDPTGGTWGLIR